MQKDLHTNTREGAKDVDVAGTDAGVMKGLEEGKNAGRVSGSSSAVGKDISERRHWASVAS